MSQLVKCIYIDAKNKTVSYRDVKFPTGKQGRKINSSKVFATTHSCETLFKGCGLNENEFYVLHYSSCYPPTNGHIYNNGFLWGKDGIQNLTIDPWAGNYNICEGDAWITKCRFVENDEVNENSNFYRKDAEFIDCDFDLSHVKNRILEWTNGTFRKTPEFSCMLNEKYDRPGEFELLLRLDNEDVLNADYDMKLDESIVRHTSQALSFTFEFCTVMIVIGRISDLNKKVKVMIFRPDSEALKMIDSCTINTKKIQSWIKNTLEKYFKDILIPQAES